MLYLDGVQINLESFRSLEQKIDSSMTEDQKIDTVKNKDINPET
jgi:hypothetical protein